jgi:hypothetical protein
MLLILEKKLNGIFKIFSAILNNRIMLHMEDKFSNVQFV